MAVTNSTGELTEYGVDPSIMEGATRIGVTWLSVPPLNIHISVPKFENISQNMRSSSPNHHKSGRALWTIDMDIVFSGTAQINSKLAALLAQFRRTPFLSLYNETIRKTITEDTDSGQTEIPIAITGYTIHTEIDLPDTLIMRLTFIIFNASPLVSNWNYLKQTVDKNNNAIYNIPALNIEDSNLFIQYYTSLIKEYDQVPDAMFGGEVDLVGKTTKANLAILLQQKPDALQDDFTSRTDLNRADVVYNGSVIRKVNKNGYLNDATSIGIGYHVNTIDQALDLKTGAYQSRRISTGGANQWISTDEDLRKDIISAVPSLAGSTASTKSLITSNSDQLLDLAVFNNASKYIKRFNIVQDQNNSRFTILGITVRRSIPINTLPIISGAMPTSQYLGGSTTDITITMETSDESFIQLISTIDRKIEESQRVVTRQSGTELTYINNDIINLNGTFVVAPTGMDIQSVPDNPGTYIITWNFSEQAEGLNTLSSPPDQIRNTKKAFIKAILTNSRHSAWIFTDSYMSDASDKYNFQYGNGQPSYVHTVLIPSFIEGIRTGFQRYIQNNFISSNAQVLINGNPVYSSENIAQALYYANLSAQTTSQAIIQMIAGIPNNPSIRITSATSQDLFNGKATVFNNLWKLFQGVAYNGPSAATAQIYKQLTNWIMLKSKDGTPQDGVAEILVDGDMKKFELMFRSPQLLNYETTWMGSSNGVLNIPNSTQSFSLDTYQKAIAKMNCYRDLGLPFTYNPVNANGIPLSGYNPAIYNDPDFYIYSGSAVPGSGSPQYSSYNPNQSAQDIKKTLNIHAENQSSSKITGGFGSKIPSTYAANTMAFSNMSTYNGPVDLTKTDPSKSNSDSLTETALAKNLKDQQANLTGTQAVLAQRFSQVKTLKPNELFMGDNIAGTMGVSGRETNNAEIFDALKEHKILKSTFYDLNPDIDHTLHNIIADARENTLSDPKYYSLNRAFPTFRLFFRVENNPQWLLFDELFDYRAVESIRYYKDKASPASTCHIILNNYNGMLTDLKALMAKRKFDTKDQNNNSQVINPYNNNPLRSLFVQAGTQIQVKMGYSGNHENLTTVFNGFVSDVQPGEKFEIICQSYGYELLTDANVGSFMGWICTPKELIWWMLLDDSVKHLGDKVDLRPMVNGVQDLGSGIFTIDDNIFMNEFLEPGSVRVLQSYSADNMSKWDLLQDLAAAHPGYICQVVPFDDRETIFFGHPDQLYKYTQDIGQSKRYRLSINNSSTNANSPATLLNFDQALQGIAKHNPDPFSVTAITSALAGSPTVPLNYMQWLSYKDKIQDTYKNWITTWSNGDTQNLDSTIELLLEYCHWVELLINIAGDPLSGNIEYNLFNVAAQTTSAISNSPNNSANYVGVPQGIPPATPSSILGTNQYIKSSSTNTNGNNTNAFDTPGATARIANEYLKSKPMYIPREIWNTLTVDTQMKIAKNLVGTPIPLSEFSPSGPLGSNLNASLGGIPLIWRGLSIDPAQASQLDTIASTAQNYFNTYDEVATANDTAGTNANQLENVLLQAYKTYGIASLLAYIAWINISAIISQLTNGANYFTTNFLNITIGQNGTVNQISNPQNGDIIITGPFNTTDLKTHKVIRNAILTKFVNISPLFQELVGEVAASPIHQRFRQYHFKSSYQHIINNNIWNNLSDMWNRVKIKYKRHDFMDLYIPILPNLIMGDSLNNDFVVQAGQTLDDRMTREIVVPIENARTVGEARNYAVSLLAEGIRHMYTGTLSLMGDPTIKPYDVIFIYDDYNKMYGPIEVKSVEHIMSHDSGFMTIVEPHAYVEPLGTSTSLAAKIANIFDYGLLALIAIPAIIDIGTSLTVGAGGAAVAAEVAEATGNTFLKDTLSNALTFGKTVTARVTSFLTEQAGVQAAAYSDAFASYVEPDVIQFLGTKFTTESEIDTAEATMKAFINQSRSSVTNSSATAITNLGQATQAELQAALNDVGFTSQQSSQFIAGLHKAALGQGLKAGLDVGLGILSTSSSFLLSAVGFTQLNIIKFLAVAGPIAYYQLMAGIDDHNYACPINITPLSYNGEPYIAGLDSVTHQSGIWNYFQGQWKKVEGSLTTIGDVITEYASSIHQIIDRT